MNDSTQAAEVSCPYPGLRPFYREESQFFFGREEHVEELLLKLETHRFVAVIGASGCGKSSLVRAGLLPMLEHGFMAEAGPHWRMATMRPGNAPFEQLAQALLEEPALGPERSDSPQSKALLEATLRRGRFGLVDAMRETLLPEGTNLLVLVDQFEEIFRYREQSSVDEAEAFVDLILASAQHRRDPNQARREVPVYVLLTMRSDFIGDCSLFLGLPEAINASQFLTPRLNRDQCRAAIVGPARALDGDVESPLVNHLLNNLRADADHLPLLQHVLARMWRSAIAAQPGAAPSLSLANLEAAGGMEQALSAHADEAFTQLGADQKRITETMFRSLCEMGDDGRATRRLVRVHEVAEIAETADDRVYPIVDVFRHPDCNFLMPPAGVPLKSDTVLDISHEALIRQWKRLSEWVADEAASAKTYRRLWQTATLWKKGEAALWRTPDLEIAEAWKEKHDPNEAWASRYGGKHDLSMEFLGASVAARSRRQRVRRWTAISAFAGVMIVAIFMAIAAIRATAAGRIAEEQKEIAEVQKVRAEQKTNEAEEQKRVAEAERIEADRQRQIADVAAKRANRSSYNAAFTGILDQWRLTTDQQELKKRLENFPKDYREFTWHFCQSLATNKEFEPAILQNNRAVNSLAYLWTKDQLLAGDENGDVQIWNAADPNGKPTPIRKLPQAKPILAVTASSATGFVAFAGDDGKIRIYDVQARQRVNQLEHGPARVRSIEFSPDGALLATAGDNNNICLWSVPAGQRLNTLAGHTNWIAKVAFSPDGKSIASASYDTTVRLWDVAGSAPARILRGHDAPAISLAFAPDGHRLASGSDDRTVKLWDTRAMKCRETLNGHAASVNALAFSPDGAILVSGDDDGELRTWGAVEPTTSQPEVQNGGVDSESRTWSAEGFILRERVSPQRRHKSGINAIAFSPSGETLATGSSDSTIMLWDANFGLRLDSRQRECQVPEARSIAFTPDSAAFAAVSKSGKAELWKKGGDERFAKDTNASEAFANISGATSVCSQQHGDLLAIGTKAGSISLCTAAGKTVATVSDAHGAPVQAMSFDPAGELLASADEQGSISVWRIGEKDLQRAIAWKRHTASVQSLAFAPEIWGRKTLASASEDGTVRIYNLDGMLAVDSDKLPEVISEFEVVMNEHEDWVLVVAFSPERPILASAGDDGVIRLYEWDSASSISPKPQRIHELTAHFGAVVALAFSPDGKTLASGGVDRIVRLWDPLEGHLRLSLPGHLAAVRSIVFLPISTTAIPQALATMSDDGAMKFWLADSPDNE